jgi:hypothetical protein
VLAFNLNWHSMSRSVLRTAQCFTVLKHDLAMWEKCIINDREMKDHICNDLEFSLGYFPNGMLNFFPVLEAHGCNTIFWLSYPIPTLGCNWVYPASSFHYLYEIMQLWLIFLLIYKRSRVWIIAQTLAILTEKHPDFYSDCRQLQASLT